MKEEFELRVVFAVKPSELYHAWLNSSLHGEMTGGEAHCSDQIGESFSAWDGYIKGKNLDLHPNKLILQAWRTSEFNEQDEDSIVKIQLNSTSDGTELILAHTNIPTGQTQYKQGWIDHYFTPMQAFFQRD